MNSKYWYYIDNKQYQQFDDIMTVNCINKHM